MLGKPVRLRLESLEHRDPAAGVSVSLAAGTLTINGSAGNDQLLITNENGSIVVKDVTGILGKFKSGSVTQINVNGGAGNDLIKIASNVQQKATVNGGTGKNSIQAGGGPTTIIDAGAASKLGGGYEANTITSSGSAKVIGGAGPNTVTVAGNSSSVQGVKISDTVTAPKGTPVLVNQPRPTSGNPTEGTINKSEVEAILKRAAAATSSNDAIIAITDRNGTILGVRMEGGVDPAVQNNAATRIFAVDGAVSLARTAAFFSNNQAPLTSRTVSVLSQSTITQREVEANPNITDVNSVWRGPGYVAPVRVGAHFPPGVPNTPEVDLFGIEHTNRDGRRSPGPDRVIGTGDDDVLAQRFNLPVNFIPAGKQLQFLDGYGRFDNPNAPGFSQNRGIATLPGGVPLYKNGLLVGGIGVFFPGKTGYATEENSVLSSTFNPNKPDRTLEAEIIAIAAAGGSSGGRRAVGTLGGVEKPAGFDLPFGRIDLVGITLDIYGPNGSEGIKKLFDLAPALGFNLGNPNSGKNLFVSTAGQTLLDGKAVPSGWLVSPHDGNGITSAEVSRIIQRGIDQADRTRAAIRLPLSSSAKMVLAVADRDGNIVGLYRQPDATVFSIDVAVAKARNVNYYADPSELKSIDQLSGVRSGVAFSNRTFRYLALPRFPSSVDGEPPGPFSILRDGGSNPLFATQVGSRLPASAFKTVYGADSFFPGTNFRDSTDTKNANGIIFFPGSSPLYGINRGLIGGFGISGDGVDQDDVVTFAGQQGFESPNVTYANDVIFNGVRLPYMKFNRNPEGL